MYKKVLILPQINTETHTYSLLILLQSFPWLWLISAVRGKFLCLGPDRQVAHSTSGSSSPTISRHTLALKGTAANAQITPKLSPTTHLPHICYLCFLFCNQLFLEFKLSLYVDLSFSSFSIICTSSKETVRVYCVMMSLFIYYYIYLFTILLFRIRLKGIIVFKILRKIHPETLLSKPDNSRTSDSGFLWSHFCFFLWL